MDVHLEIIHDKSRVKNVTLKPDTLIGRSRDCDLRVPVDDVSRHHCRISISDSKVLLRVLHVGPVKFIVQFEPPGQVLPETTDFESIAAVVPADRDTAEFVIPATAATNEALPEADFDHDELSAAANNPPAAVDVIDDDDPALETGPDVDGSVVDLQPADADSKILDDPAAHAVSDADPDVELHSLHELVDAEPEVEAIPAEPDGDTEDGTDVDATGSGPPEEPVVTDDTVELEVAPVADEPESDAGEQSAEDETPDFGFTEADDDAPDNDPVADNGLTDFLNQFDPD